MANRRPAADCVAALSQSQDLLLMMQANEAIAWGGTERDVVLPVDILVAAATLLERPTSDESSSPPSKRQKKMAKIESRFRVSQASAYDVSAPPPPLSGAATFCNTGAAHAAQVRPVLASNLPQLPFERSLARPNHGQSLELKRKWPATELGTTKARSEARTIAHQRTDLVEALMALGQPDYSERVEGDSPCPAVRCATAAIANGGFELLGAHDQASLPRAPPAPPIDVLYDALPSDSETSQGAAPPSEAGERERNTGGKPRCLFNFAFSILQPCPTSVPES